MSEASPRFRRILQDLPGYQPGATATAAAGRSFKLSSNECPFGPLPSVVKVIAEAAQSVNRYPDTGAGLLTTAIAERFSVPPEHVALGCGSVGVAQQLLEAVGEPGAEILYAWRSFEAYPILAGLAAATSVRVPLRGEVHDLPAMADAITARTRLVFVCNPNNPTGTVVHSGELTEFLDRVPPDCLVVLDEAYREYIRDESVPDGLSLYRDRPNVAILRTFSKAYGLAGLRAGFMIAHSPVAQAARKTMLPFTVNSIAQAAAVASLAAEAELLERVEATVKERTPGPRGADRRRLDRATDRGQLRLAAAGGGDRGLRGELRPGRGQRPALRRRGGPGVDRRARGQRHLPCRGPRLPCTGPDHGARGPGLITVRGTAPYPRVSR